jgi:hypothetical protein
MSILVPDINATAEVNFECVRVAHNNKILASIANDKGEDLAPGIERVPEADDPVAIIGYIPPAKMTEIRQRIWSRMDDAGEVKDIDTATLLDINRDVCRWGLKGWKNVCSNKGEIPFYQSKAKHRDRDIDIAANEVIDVIEIMGWVNSLASEISAYNTLDDSKKKGS